jgi:hypothetical protein
VTMRRPCNSTRSSCDRHARTSHRPGSTSHRPQKRSGERDGDVEDGEMLLCKAHSAWIAPPRSGCPVCGDGECLLGRRSGAEVGGHHTRNGRRPAPSAGGPRYGLRQQTTPRAPQGNGTTTSLSRAVTFLKQLLVTHENDRRAVMRHALQADRLLIKPTAGARPASPCTLRRFIAKARPDARRVTSGTDDTTLATAPDGPTPPTLTDP